VTRRCEPQVNAVITRRQVSEFMFEFIPLSRAPAGFEPALTAPEAVALYGPDQRKLALARLARARIGRNPQDRAAGHSELGVRGGRAERLVRWTGWQGHDRRVQLFGYQAGVR